MGKRTFSAAERWAVYVVHGEKCYIEGHPIDLQSMQVDHILPESLLDDPDKLAETLRIFGLPPTFNINSYENWLPACGKHNNLKRAMLFNPSPLIQIHLQKASEKAHRARQIEKETVSDTRLARAINEIERAVDASGVDPILLKCLVTALVEARGYRRIDRILPDADIRYHRTDDFSPPQMSFSINYLEYILSILKFAALACAITVLVFAFDRLFVRVILGYSSALIALLIGVAAYALIYRVVGWTRRWGNRSSKTPHGMPIRLTPNLTIPYADAVRMATNSSEYN